MNNLIESQKEIYLQNVSEHWKSEVATSEKVYILSPYITSNTAEEVLAGSSDCEIYTLFDIESFISGSSSIETLKNLIQKNFKIYSLPQLHAKIILIRDKFVSIGSQNLTNQGCKNKEATFISNNLHIVRFVEKELKERWLTERKMITFEQMEDMEKFLTPLIEDYKKLKKRIEDAERSFADNQKQKDYQRRIERFKIKLKEIEKTQEFVLGRVKYVEASSYWYGWNRPSIMTFMTDQQRPDLLNWRIGNEEHTLKKTNRYLCLIENTGKLGWARVMKTRISKYGQGVSSAKDIVINEKGYDLWFRANWDPNTLTNYNLTINIDNGNCEVYVWFDLSGLEIIEIKTKPNINLDSWIKGNEELFKKSILEKLLHSFKYKENLYGEDASKFLEEDKKYKLKLGKLGKQKLLIFSET